MKPGIRSALLAAAALLAGCNTVPSTNIKQPLTAPPPAKSTVIENNGSIFQPGRGLALFEDRRARHVGDTLTVNLVEKTSATRKSETAEDRSASADINVPVPRVFNKTPQVLGVGATTWNPSSQTNQAFKDNDSNSNSFSGAITVTVIEVLPNGNLRVSGEKQLAVNNDTDYIRLTGVVNPAYLSSTNSINSTQLADAQIESKNSQGLDQAQLASMFARFFLTLVPF
ncbi:flagellar L-ring protein precursor FlgH [Sulfuritortus calidifontis]|uniref:Flagellar L-ring protein n=1 Tax=Sulfuritortus calidifontis TaxID=1914471 RepID=A0A4R3JUK9_9PROT|nr:flagellar basal body L-ring protein FlgH [Sulfuritortus calidifontis]TCS71514.1 flagellar L-ring protein precursor FlgH [Sulfuritortus calidifontis]